MAAASPPAKAMDTPDNDPATDKPPLKGPHEGDDDDPYATKMEYSIQGGKAQIVQFRDSEKEEHRWPVRQFSVSKPQRDYYGRDYVWISYVHKGCRKAQSVCPQTDHYLFWTIEQDGAVVYDSRNDIPFKTAAELIAEKRAEKEWMISELEKCVAGQTASVPLEETF
jgi:hypothetical protein